MFLTLNCDVLLCGKPTAVALVFTLLHSDESGEQQFLCHITAFFALCPIH